MKSLYNFFQSIPNKIKSIYLIWIFLQVLLLLIGGNGFENYRNDFYPVKIGWGKTYFFDPEIYDYSEFVVYILAPLYFYAIIYLWKKK